MRILTEDKINRVLVDDEEIIEPPIEVVPPKKDKGGNALLIALFALLLALAIMYIAKLSTNEQK